MEFNSILVVCAGNICRSPMGEAFFKERLAKLDDKKHIKVDSAGIVGLVNHPADDHALSVMQDIGYDMSQHQGKKLNEALITEFDLVLAMTNKQVKDIEQRWAFSKGRVFRLGQWQNLDIADPYKHGIDSFIEARNLIDTAVDSWIENL